MKVGIVGLPRSGKSTIFGLLTGIMNQSRQDSKGMFKVPDDRIDLLTGMFNPKKTVYAQMEIVDLPGLEIGDKAFAKMIAPMRNVDSLLCVVGAYEGEANPAMDASAFSDELILADMALAENRIAKLETSKKRTPEEDSELSLMKRLSDEFAEGKSIRQLSLSDEEIDSLRGYGMLSLKPLLMVANLSDIQFSNKGYQNKDELVSFCSDRNIVLIELSAQTEMDISQLPEEEREVFFEEYGIEETGLQKVAQAVYASLGMISFFTVGEDEVRAWPIVNGTNAKRAAGKIHTDIEKGFIRAETISYDDLVRCKSMAVARTEGTFRLEGKEYIVKDGDIINFRFAI